MQVHRAFTVSGDQVLLQLHVSGLLHHGDDGPLYFILIAGEFTGSVDVNYYINILTE